MHGLWKFTLYSDLPVWSPWQHQVWSMYAASWRCDELGVAWGGARVYTREHPAVVESENTYTNVPTFHQRVLYTTIVAGYNMG